MIYLLPPQLHWLIQKVVTVCIRSRYSIAAIFSNLLASFVSIAFRFRGLLCFFSSRLGITHWWCKNCIARSARMLSGCTSWRRRRGKVLQPMDRGNYWWLLWCCIRAWIVEWSHDWFLGWYPFVITKEKRVIVVSSKYNVVVLDFRCQLRRSNYIPDTRWRNPIINNQGTPMNSVCITGNLNIKKTKGINRGTTSWWVKVRAERRWGDVCCMWWRAVLRPSAGPTEAEYWDTQQLSSPMLINRRTLVDQQASTWYRGKNTIISGIRFF